MSHPASPITVQHLLSAYADGSATLESVFAPFLAAADAPTAIAPQDPAWISRAPAAILRQQLAALQGQSPATKPLFGIPFAVKDNIDVAGLPTTAACPEFTYTPAQSATAVRRLQDAGAIVVGKTNLDQFATGLVGTRTPYGIPCSTFSDSHVSGGSSSGSAVVVSRGEVPFALGTDTAGSGRVPAGFNNIVGLKPTPGLVPSTGVVPACQSLDCVSVFALTSTDAVRVLDCMAGLEPNAAVFNTVTAQPPRWPSQKTLRVGIPTSLSPFEEADYLAAFSQATQQWQHLQDREGRPWPVELVPVDLAPFLAVARLLYEGAWVAERDAAIGDLLRGQPEVIHPVVRTIVESAHGQSATDAFKGLYALKQLAARIAPVWQSMDVLMVPTAPNHPTLASVAADPIARNAQLGTYTNFVNLLGLSALALPASLLPDSQPERPFGITLIAEGGRDAALADVGTCWQRLLSLQAAKPLTLGHHLGMPSPSDLMWPLSSTQLDVAPGAEPVIALAVVGAHLQGMPLHSQLVERRAHLIEATFTAPCYQLHALPGTVPPKPGLSRIATDAPPESGHSIALEVYAIPASQIGSFLSLIPPPLGLGSVELADGRWVKGFICEPWALGEAENISHFGGWRAYIKHLQSQK